jgi:hypothetical protein
MSAGLHALLPAPPWMSSSTLIAEARPLSGKPQVTAIRPMAIEGAHGP